MRVVLVGESQMAGPQVDSWEYMEIHANVPRDMLPSALLLIPTYVLKAMTLHGYLISIQH